MTRPLTTLLLIGLALAPGGAVASSEKSPPLADLDVLVVSPEASTGHGAWIEECLGKLGATVTRGTWSLAAAERVKAFDLVVVTGRERRVGGDVVLHLDRPVLGLGSYGHAYFGRMRLKHGAPFS